MRLHIPSALIGATAGGAAVVYVSGGLRRPARQRRRDAEGDGAVVAADKGQQTEGVEAFGAIGTFGLPRGERIIQAPGFISCVDGRSRTPKWVVERLTRDSTRGDGHRKNSQWEEEAGAPSHLRARLDDYRGSGYDRGHLAPAMNHKGSQKAMDSTFTLANCAPQVGAGFNRDYWARIEWFVRGLAHREGTQAVYVATGPLYLPQPTGDGRWRMQHDMLGKAPALVSVPTHFYKCVVVEGEGGRGAPTSIGAFVIPNAPIPPGAPLEAFAVPLKELEAAAGISFFDKAGRPRAGDEERVMRRARAAREQLTAGGGRQLALPPPNESLPERAYREDDAAKGSRALRHLCERPDACVLPRERFWENSGGKKKEQRTLPPRQ